MQANDHVPVDFVFRRHHHDATALSSSDAKWGRNAVLVRNQRPLVAGFNIACESKKEKSVLELIVAFDSG